MAGSKEDGDTQTGRSAAAGFSNPRSVTLLVVFFGDLFFVHFFKVGLIGCVFLVLQLFKGLFSKNLKRTLKAGFGRQVPVATTKHR